MQPCVYIVTDRRHGTLYTGVTGYLPQRIWQHRMAAIGGFSRRYGLKRLVWYERHAAMEDAIRREKQIKTWKRGWRIELIEKMNPTWKDLYEDLNR